MKAMTGRLYLLPNALGEAGALDFALPFPVIETVRRLRHFVVENAKPARAYLKRAGVITPIAELSLRECNQRTSKKELTNLLQPVFDGHDLGLLSDAGCPAVADVGMELVALAHQRGVVVRPLVGPSSLLLALMASGLNGQRFAFHGYVPIREDELAEEIRRLERESRERSQTQVCIETPYRNERLFQALLRHCQGATRLCVATNLTQPSESIATRTIAEWNQRQPPSLHKQPTVFLWLAQ